MASYTWPAQNNGSAGVSSLNALIGDISLTSTGGTITITPSGSTINLEAVNVGTVTSVGLADNTGVFTISGSPVTSSGTLTLSGLQNQSANVFFAGPASGGAGTPSLRHIVGADLPNPSASTLGGIQSNAGTTSEWIDSISTAGVPHLSQPFFDNIGGTLDLTSQVTGLLPVANGGTGDSSFTAYSVLCGGATSSGSLQNVSGVGTSGQILTSNGASALPTWQAAAAPVFSGLTQYGVMYASTTSAIASTAAGTAGFVLTSNATSAPTFQALPSINGFSYLASNTSVYGGTFSTLSFTGGGNSVIGVGAGNSSMSGINNTLFGAGAGASMNNILAAGNTLIGYNAGTAINTGGDNTAIGTLSGAAITTGMYNIAIGGSALTGITTGSYNTMIGIAAGSNLGTSSSSNVFIGYSAGQAQTGVVSNTFLLTNISQVSSANELAYSLMYGTFSGSSGSLTGQTLTVNAATITLGPVQMPTTSGTSGQVLTSSGSSSSPMTWSAAGGTPNFGVSSGSGSFTTTSGSSTPITNLSVTLTTVGNPVQVSFQPLISSSVGSQLSIAPTSGSGFYMEAAIKILRDGTVIAEFIQTLWAQTGSEILTIPCSSVSILDTGASAASHTYTATVFVAGTTTFSATNITLAVFEL